MTSAESAIGQSPAVDFSPTVEITGIRLRPLIVPLRRPLATRVGLFTEGPFIAIDLETKGGATGRVLGFTFHKLGLKLVPPVLEALTEFAAGQRITFTGAAAFPRSLPETPDVARPRRRRADGAVDVRHGALRRVGP